MTRVTIELHGLADQTNNVELILKPVIGDEWVTLLDRRDSVALRTSGRQITPTPTR